MKSQSFVKGAALLALATALGKILSAIFKIPLDRFFLHEEGMAIFNSAYNVYTFFFATATAGIPLAISSLVASGDEDEGGKVLSTALISICSLLLLCSAGIFILAEPIANLTGIKASANALRIIAPALFFFGITASLKGFFQGKLIMQPSALSQVCDSFGRLCLGFLMAFLFINSPLEVKAPLALCGVPLGAALSSLVFILFFVKSGYRLKPSFSSDALKKLVLLSVPITLTVSMHQIFNLADTLTVVPGMTHFGYADATKAFGCLSRSAMLYALPVSIASAVSQSILPAISHSFKENDISRLSTDSSLAIRLSMAISLPCSVGFIALPKEILTFLFDSHPYYETLVYIGFSALFLSVGATLSSILQGVGKVRYTVFSALSALLFKIISTPLLIHNMGINGAPLATTLSYLVFSITLFIALASVTPIRLSFFRILFQALLCAAVCFVSARFFSALMHIVPAILLTGTVYLIMMFMSHFVRIKELRQIFSA